MHFERITDAKHPMYQTAMELYRQSFPLHEQRETSSQEDILRHTDYHFTLCYDESLFTGLVLYWETADFLYVEHFCILPELRSRHYGQHILEELGRYGKTIILRSIRRQTRFLCGGKAFMSAVDLRRIPIRIFIRPTIRVALGTHWRSCPVRRKYLRKNMRCLEDI